MKSLWGGEDSVWMHSEKMGIYIPEDTLEQVNVDQGDSHIEPKG